MNKNAVNTNLEKAHKALKDSGIVENGKIKKTYRGQISTFGAAVTTGSLLPAIAFFCDKGGSEVDRNRLMEAIARVLDIVKEGDQSELKDKTKKLYDYAAEQTREGNYENCKERILNAAISLKLAMNLYELTN